VAAPAAPAALNGPLQVLRLGLIHGRRLNHTPQNAKDH
jgi:hypothetical protein